LDAWSQKARGTAKVGVSSVAQDNSGKRGFRGSSQEVKSQVNIMTL
jgi:hypothetical protein